MHTHTHTHMQKPFCPHLSPVRTFSNTHTDTGSHILHPCSIQPPTLLKAATLGACACESGCGLSSPHRRNPPLWVAREMKALGVHYKTTTASAGDRPPGATNYPFSSLHPHLFAFCPSISQLQSAVLSVTHSCLALCLVALRRICFLIDDIHVE